MSESESLREGDRRQRKERGRLEDGEKVRPCGAAGAT